MKLTCPRCDWVSFESDDRGQLERSYKGHVAAKHHLSLLFDPTPHGEAWAALRRIDPDLRRRLLTWVQQMNVHERGSGYLLADSEVLEDLFAVFGVETEISRAERLVFAVDHRPVVAVRVGNLL